MIIKSIRYGFANNSSSSHSIVFLGDGAQTKRKSDSEGREFGWSYFTCANEETKSEYLLTSLNHNLRNVVNYIPRIVITEKIGWKNPFNDDTIMKKYELKYEEYLSSKYKKIEEYYEQINDKMAWDIICKEFAEIFITYANINT